MSGKPAGSCTLVMAAVVINPPRSRTLPKPDLRRGCGWGLCEPIREQRPAEARGSIKVPLRYHQDRGWLRILVGCPANHAALFRTNRAPGPKRPFGGFFDLRH